MVAISLHLNRTNQRDDIPNPFKEDISVAAPTKQELAPSSVTNYRDGKCCNRLPIATSKLLPNPIPGPWLLACAIDAEGRKDDLPRDDVMRACCVRIGALMGKRRWCDTDCVTGNRRRATASSKRRA